MSNHAMIGHNNGPPIGDIDDAPSVARRYYWRKAHAAAWRTPPIEIVRLRSRAAERIGLDYRDYTSILLDRGRRPSAVVFTLRTLVRSWTGNDLRLMPGVQSKLERLAGNCSIFVVAQADTGALERHPVAIQRINDLCGDCIEGFRVLPAGADSTVTGRAIAAMLTGRGLPTAQAIFVGDRTEDEYCAKTFGFARFLWAWHYFGEAARPPQ